MIKPPPPPGEIPDAAEAEVWCGVGDDEDGLWGWVIINDDSLRWCVSE